MIKAIVPLGRNDRAAFSCAVAALDDWFHLRAGQDEKRNVARVFVAIDDERGIVGFYSLSSFTLAIADASPSAAGSAPRLTVLRQVPSRTLLLCGRPISQPPIRTATFMQASRSSSASVRSARARVPTIPPTGNATRRPPARRAVKSMWIPSPTALALRLHEEAPEYRGLQSALAGEMAVATTAAQLRTCHDPIAGNIIKAVPIE